MKHMMEPSLTLKLQILLVDRLFRFDKGSLKYSHFEGMTILVNKQWQDQVLNYDSSARVSEF
jgi:hypothetical protein